jgi:vacuolar-type H+-ATPase subunit E/Vma4
MSQLNKIIDKITDEANEKASEILASADETIVKLKMENTAKIENLKQELTTDAEKAAQDYHEKLLSKNRQKVLTDTLATKRKVIGDCFEHSLKLFSGLNDADYKEIITKIVDKHKDLPNVKVTYLDNKLGVIIKSGKIVYNYSFAEIAEFLRPELEPKVSKILFA